MHAYSLIMRKVVILVVLILGASVTTLFSYPQFKRIEKRSAVDLQSVEALLPTNVTTVAQAIQKIWERRTGRRIINSTISGWQNQVISIFRTTRNCKYTRARTLSFGGTLRSILL